MNKLPTLYLLVIILLISNIYFIAKNSALKKEILGMREEILEIKKSIGIQEINEKVLSFTQLFIDKVLKAEGEVDFETRLKLETEVRELKDEEILNQWQKFVDSKSEIEAQEELKNLLSILVDKIKLSQ